MIRGTLLRAVRLGVGSLLLHKLRSMLTTLGVLIGVGCVILALAVAEGASKKAQDLYLALGSQNVILRSIKPREDFATGSQATRVVSYGLLRDDLSRVEKTFPGINRVVPLRELPFEVRYQDRALNPKVLSTLPIYREVAGRIVSEGRFLTEADEYAVANVCVLSDEVARYLFPFRSPIGEKVKIGADYFVVVGTTLSRKRLDDDPAIPGQPASSEVFIPLETGRKWYGDLQVKIRSGSREMEEVQLHEIVIEVGAPENVSMVAAAAREMLARNHRNPDYELVVPLELIHQAEENKRIWKYVLAIIASVSLIVGGIGIMNVMLATVTERTREIGIRRALGAKQRHIVTQFLVETVVLSFGGGILGVLAGLSFAKLLAVATDMPTIVTPLSPVIAFGISVAVGIVFGLYPAWRAANMDPVEALRHE